MATQTEQHKYYVPEPSAWPFVMTIAMFTFALGLASWLNGAETVGPYIFAAGLALILVMTFIWFRGVIRENQAGAYGHQEEMTFRWAMSWFIFSEVMFFGAFFGALFYARMLSVPWLAGEGSEFTTNAYLWEGFEAAWPTNGPGNVGGTFDTIPPWGVPFLNTIILLTSGVTITIAHWGLKENNRLKLNLGLAATVALGAIFLFFQAEEYIHAYQDLNLTLSSGIYGSTFFMLTGFHGAHVTLGTIMLLVILLRCIAGHFSAENHFGFEAVAWYWHFVDVVWLGLFVFVYIL
ncbi:cytochrome C oxidase subunit III [Salinisphaera sp. PC39]|uniref:cytochrome c oxidase subunit 3 n=1 Tax=Salinisphaera sp. PC39 TaxID=1304156 RepID=UPI0033429DEA